MSEQGQVTGEKSSYAAGQVLFKEGDPGGDLFLIKSGQIEVYREQNNARIRLAVLEKGEILGVMTCLTRDPRLASARALTDVEALIVKQAGFNNLIASTPKWVKTVIKDFIVRIKNLNQMYGDLVTKFRHAERRTSNLALAANLLSYLESYAKQVSDDQIELGPVIDNATNIFECSRPSIVGILDALGKAGVIELDDGAEGRVRKMKLEGCQPFASYTRSYLQQPELDITENIGKEELLLCLKIVEVAKFTGLNFQSEVRLKMAKIKTEVDKLKHGLFHRSKLEIPQKLRWLSIDKGNEESLLFTPQELEIKAKSVHAWMQIEELEHSSDVQIGEGAQVISEDF